MILKKLPDNAALKPDYDGCEFLYFAVVKVSDIKLRFEKTDIEFGCEKDVQINIRPIDSSSVRIINDAISEGYYDTKSYEPPMMSESGELYIGKHRYEAHNLANLKYIVVAVVRFTNLKNKKPIYWLRIAQACENNKPVFKKQGTDETTVHIIKTQIKEKTIKYCVKEIEESLKLQKIKNGKKRKRLIEELLNKKSYQEVPEKFSTKGSKKNWFNKNYPGKKLSTPTKIVPNNNEIFMLNEYRTKNDKYPIVHPYILIQTSTIYPEKKIKALYNVNTDSCKQVKVMRVFVPKNLIDQEKNICKMADHIRSKNYKRPQQIFIPQLKEDSKK